MKYISAFFLLFVFSAAVFAQANFPIQGKLEIDYQNISGLVVTDTFAVLATDEGTALQILRQENGKFIARSNGVVKLTQDNLELDLEGLAWQKPYLYAIGSHSKKRKKVKQGDSEKKTLKRLSKVIEEPSRNQLFQIALNDKFEAVQIRSQSLTSFLEQNEILAPFGKIPSKENGIDIEGVAVKEDRLFIGFRGPVLRGNLAAIMTFKLNEKKFRLKKPELKLVNLGGLGIRDMVATNKGLLLLAGPMNEIPNLYQLFNWQGENDFDSLKPVTTLQGAWLTGKPEAITQDQKGQLWLGQDGPKNGAIRQMD